jgi:hypothetical protein
MSALPNLPHALDAHTVSFCERVKPLRKALQLADQLDWRLARWQLENKGDAACEKFLREMRAKLRELDAAMVARARAVTL